MPVRGWPGHQIDSVFRTGSLSLLRAATTRLRPACFTSSRAWSAAEIKLVKLSSPRQKRKGHAEACRHGHAPSPSH